MIAIDVGRKRTVMDNTTPVTIADTPAAGKKRQVVSIRVTNLDDQPVDVIIFDTVAGVTLEIDRREGLAVHAVWQVATKNEPYAILPTDSMTAALVAPANATQPVCRVVYLESTD